MTMNRFLRSAAVVSLAASIGSGCSDLRNPDDRADLAGGQSGMDRGVLDGFIGLRRQG